MTQLKEIIEGFRMKANAHYNPSMDGIRDARMEGRKEAYLDCANILEKWRNSIDETELDELAYQELGPKDYNDMDEFNATLWTSEDYLKAYKAGYRKAMEE